MAQNMENETSSVTLWQSKTSSLFSDKKNRTSKYMKKSSGK